MLKKKPYLVKLISDEEEAKAKVNDFFSEENASMLPSYVQDCMGSCDIFEKENDDSTIIFGNSPVATFIKQGKVFPIVILCHDRADFLKKTLESLLNVRKIEKINILKHHIKIG